MMAKGDKNNPMAAMMGQMGMGFSSAKLGGANCDPYFQPRFFPTSKTRPGPGPGRRFSDFFWGTRSPSCLVDVVAAAYGSFRGSFSITDGHAGGTPQKK